MKLQATKFVLASAAAAQQARLIGLQLQQETDATAMLDASLAVHQLHLRKSIAAMDLRESRAFAEGLMGSLASPARADVSGGEADALVRWIYHGFSKQHVTYSSATSSAGQATGHHGFRC